MAKPAATSRGATPWRPQIIAHRAKGFRRWQNSLPAFRAAAAAGVDAIELDVRLTLDGVPVVAHDPVVTAATRPWVIAESVYPAVAWRTPRLDAVLEAIGTAVIVDVEIKPQPAALDGLWPLVRARPRTRLSSFDWDIVAACREQAPVCERAVLVPRGESLAAALRAANDTAATAIHLSLRQTRREWVDAIHDAGLAVRVYTANRAEAWRRLATLGVDAVFTDRPAAFKAWLAEDA